jgi:hypothetical protein
MHTGSQQKINNICQRIPMHRAIVAIGRDNGRINAIELKYGRHAVSFLGPVISERRETS